MASPTYVETPGAKMVYLIKRRSRASHEELIAHWFANHMPPTIARMEHNREAGKLHATRYVATLFDPRADKPQAWDGMANLWYEEVPPPPPIPHGTEPTDTFQEMAEPYHPWATREYLAMDGALPLEPPTLDPPFPCTRSGFFKVTFLVPMQAGGDREALFAHWLEVHIPNVRHSMEGIGGFRYAVSHSLQPETEPYAGMAELYFANASGWARYREHIKPDGMQEWVDYERLLIFTSGTEMVGIA